MGIDSRTVNCSCSDRDIAGVYRQTCDAHLCPNGHRSTYRSAKLAINGEVGGPRATSSLASRNSEVDLDLVVLEGDQGQGRSGVGRTRTAGECEVLITQVVTGAGPRGQTLRW
jgi:hypothetical protein